MKKIILFLSLLFSVTVNAQVITSGLSSYYPFNGNANDMGAGGNHGNPGTCTLTSDRFGLANKAYQLNAALTDMINIDKVLPYSDFSLSYWMLPYTFGDNQNNLIMPQPIDWRSSTLINPIFQVVLYMESGNKKIEFRLRDNNYTSGSNAAKADLVQSESPWYHVVCTFDATGKIMKLYLNGMLALTRTYNYTSTFSFDKLRIGNNYYPNLNPNYNQKYQGKIDDIYIFNRVITDKEVQTLYNEQPPTSVQEIHDISNYVSLYPNPLQGQKTLNLSFTAQAKGKYQAKLWNMNGQTVETFQLYSGMSSLNLNRNLPAGNYIFALYNEQGEMLGTQQLIVQ